MTPLIRQIFTDVIILVFALGAFSVNATNASVPLKELGQFELAWGTPEVANIMPGSNRLGTVAFKPGSSMKISFPFSIQQSHILLNDGDKVEENQPLANVNGVELEHFWVAAESAKAIYNVTKAHFEASKSSFREKTLKNPEWLAMVKNYHQAKLDLEHHQHYMTMLERQSGINATVNSPITGILKINRNYTGAVDETFLEVIPQNELKVEVFMPASSTISSLVGFAISDSSCILNVDAAELRLQDYFQRIWASAENQACTLSLGQSLRLTPLFSLSGYRIDRRAILAVNGVSYVALKDGDNVDLSPVSIQGSSGNYLYITSNQPLHSREVLVSSVGALQGILIGLGGE